MRVSATLPELSEWTLPIVNASSIFVAISVGASDVGDFDHAD